jgi:hypothetical protein
MKIKCLFLTALLLTITTIGFAQAKKPTTKTTASKPEQVIKDLYAAQKNEKTNPFAQIKSRALVDKYFTKDLADLVWKTNTAPDDGWRHIDVLYDSHDQLRDSQDPQITNLAFGTPYEDSGPNDVYVKVTFKNHGEPESVSFNLRREANKTWKIDDINYSHGDDLSYVLRYKTDAEYQKDYDADTFQGDYMVGTTQCRIERTMSRFEFYRVTCDGQEGFKIYAVDGNEKETAYIHTDDKGKETGKFVFKGDEKNGKFIDASGKEVKVKRVQ